MTFKTIDLQVCGVYLYESKHQDGDIVNEHHHQCHQILYALDGEGTITLDKKRHPFSQDNAALIVPFSNHAVVSDSKLTLLVLAFDAIRLDPNTLSSLLRTYFQSSAFIKLNPFAGSELRQLLRKMLFEQSRQDPLGDWAFTIYLLEILLILARSNQPFHATDSNSLRAERIRSYMDTHYFEKLSADDIGARLGITARYVNDIFKAKYGITPTQYISEVRIELAKKLLVETDKDIVSIAFEVGYETLSTFYRNFKNIIQIAPNHFRQMHQTQEKE